MLQSYIDRQLAIWPPSSFILVLTHRVSEGFAHGWPRSSMNSVVSSGSDVSSFGSTTITTSSNSSDLSSVSAQNSTAAPSSSSADSSSRFMSASVSAPAHQLPPRPPLKTPTAPDSASSTGVPAVKTATTPDNSLSTPLPPVKAPTAPDSVPSTTTMLAASSTKSSQGDALNSSSSANPSLVVVKSGSSSKSSVVVKTGVASPTDHSSSANPAGHPSSPASPPPPTNPINQQVSFTGTTTSTITDAPESTLAKPSFISVVESNGKTSFIAPPLVTILSSSREPNGSFVTFTHVVANPTGFGQAISGGHASFFNNAGAVAGVFLVVGGILTAIAAFVVFIMCRRRRRRRERHRRWLISINRPRNVTDDPFQSPRSPPSPPIRVVPPEWDTEHRQEMSESGLGLYNVPQSEHGQYAEPQHFEQLQAYYDGAGLPPQNVGLAISTDVNRSKPSLAQSSPSIYPPSLPPANDDRLVEEAPLPQRRYSSDASVAPPRPRRSHLREPSKAQLITPPSSVSSHSPVSEFGGPFGFTSLDSERAPVQPGSPQLNEIMGRRTLLDVRPRTRDNNE